MPAHRSIIYASFAALLSLAVQAEPPIRPNILYFYVDDMGWGALGPNGQFERKAKGQPYLITPTLDRMAKEGVTFARSYGCTVCSPARSSQQTGFHQGHTFADQNDPDNAKKAIRTEDLTMGDTLSGAGYVTGYWGKWGYGGSANKDPYPKILNVETLPTSHGYEHVVAELHHVRAHTFYQPNLWKAPAVPGARGGLELVPNSMERYRNRPEYPNTPALQNHPDYPKIAYCDDVYAFAALDFVRIQAQNYNATGQPFFALLAGQVPHSPFNEIEDLPEWDKAYREKSWFKGLPDQDKQWAAMITRIDAHFGNILDALEDPNGDGDDSDSVADKTLIVFQSDNGGPRGAGLNTFASNSVLSGFKTRIQEGGIRVPLTMRLPADFKPMEDMMPGSKTDRIVDVTDLLPTFCELAGVPAPLAVDGVSLAPALTGRGHQRVREFLIHEAGNGQSIIRGDYKLIRSKKGFALFNLTKDPGESKDLADRYPDMVIELRTLMLAERVDEPKGFANTYHEWIGPDEGAFSLGKSWSDYVYANEGITHMSDDGDPRVSWVARIANEGSSDSQVTVDLSTSLLGLEITGTDYNQTVQVPAEVELIGRNEIRVSDKGILELGQGIVSSVRWVDVMGGGELRGGGSVNSSVFNQGLVSVGNSLQISSDYISSNSSQLIVELEANGNSGLKIGGSAHLDGDLQIVVSSTGFLEKGKRFEILTADSVKGRFSNANDEVVSSNGQQFRIAYGGASVSVIVQ